MSETMEKYVNTVMDGFKKSMILKMYRNNEPIERITEYADTTEDEVKAVIAGQGGH